MSPLGGGATVMYLGLVLAAALLLTSVMRRVSLRCGWVALPSADRWHRVPTALHGGVGIFVPFFVASLTIVLLGWAEEVPEAAASLPIPLPYAFLAGALGMFLFGLLDDIYRFKPATKFVCQLIAANIFVLAGGVLGVTGFLPLDLLLTYFWFIGITNALNMLDNMDGLASGVAIIALGSTVFLIHVAAGGAQPSIGFFIGLALIAATLGFWVFNRPPASIFMGDSGALFLGYVMAALTVPSSLNGFLGVQGLAPVMTLIVPVTVLAVPIFDTTLVTLTRQLRAQAPTVGGRDHSSHRLVGLGLSERGAVWILYLMAAFGGSLAMLMARFPEQSLPVFGFYALFLTLVGVYLGHRKIQEKEPGAKLASWTPLVKELFHKRRAAEVLLDLILVVLCFQAAHLLRFDGALAPETSTALRFSYPFVVPSYVAAFFLMGIYRGRWKFITVADLTNYAGAVLLGTALSLSAITIAGRFGLGHSRSAYIIHALLLFLAMTAARLSFRVFDNFANRLSVSRAGEAKTRVLIYGAGRGGKFLFDEMMYNPEYTNSRAIGFIDDDPELWGQALGGLRVRGVAAWFEGKRRELAAEVWISSIKITDDRVRAELQRRGADVHIRRLHVSVSDLAAPAKLA
jgi:UDP-GlcNAc:undecaprenyl-phosphate GlcNAc-1-phosphate transferase